MPSSDCPWADGAVPWTLSVHGPKDPGRGRYGALEDDDRNNGRLRRRSRLGLVAEQVRDHQLLLHGEGPKVDEFLAHGAYMVRDRGENLALLVETLVDGIESFVGAIQALIDTIESLAGGTEALIDAIESLIDAIKALPKRIKPCKHRHRRVVRGPHE